MSQPSKAGGPALAELGLEHQISLSLSLNDMGSAR
jgi:hypothetical protein